MNEQKWRAILEDGSQEVFEVRECEFASAWEARGDRGLAVGSTARSAAFTYALRFLKRDPTSGACLMPLREVLGPGELSRVELAESIKHSERERAAAMFVDAFHMGTLPEFAARIRGEEP